MFRKPLAALGGAFLMVLAASPVMAQSSQDLTNPVDGPAARAGGGVRAGIRDRIRSRDQQTPAVQTSEEIKASAQTALTAAGTGCTVTEAISLGQDAGQNPVFEAACSTGPGYIIATSTPPIVSDCLILAHQADAATAAAATANAEAAAAGAPTTTYPRCSLPANADLLKVVQAYAVEAGVNCTVDEGAPVGQIAGNLVYEIGCANADGALIEKQPTGWKTTSCLMLLSRNGTCRFTTAQDSAATVKAWLTGSDAADCDVTQARFMGSNANGAFYEAKCAAGDGYIARLNTEFAVQQTYPCATAQRIGGGCTLTPVPAAPEATAPAPTQE